jgi:GAF domain-containing protein
LVPEQQSVSPRAAHAANLLETVLAEADSTALDHLVDTATTELSGDGALLSLLTDRQVVIAASGSLAPQICRATEIAFDDTVCANVLRSDGTLAIPDTALDARVSSAPVVRAGALGAYLGAPVRCGGHTVGVLCVYNEHPRPWTEDDIAALTRIADEAATQLTLRE